MYIVNYYFARTSAEGKRKGAVRTPSTYLQWKLIGRRRQRRTRRRDIGCADSSYTDGDATG